MKLSELDEIHRSPGSWILGVVYFARRDPRLLVRKRIGALGWTLNFARPLAIPFLLVTLLVLWLGLDAVASLEWSKSVKWGAAFGLISTLIAVWAWAANPRRYID
ncbi:DUF5808 domain-containing protein [Haloferula sp. BvORR071]|uniref:DUF5808 domain-containing protein n=1 Tax=Haloferula sp. BvORR071 TaxID=1396141 RepID=UPI000553D968